MLETDSPRSVFVKSRFASIILFIVIYISGCENPKILVLKDPYIDAVSGGKWKPSSLGFSISMWFNGFSVDQREELSSEKLIAILEEAEPKYSRIILSPWNVTLLKEISPGSNRFIIAGGSAGTESSADFIPDIKQITIDRRKTMAKIAEIAAVISETAGKPVYALFNNSTAKEKREIEIFKENYNENSSQRIIFPDMSALSDEDLPSDFNSNVKESSLLLLFAGIINIRALEISEEFGIAVITENIINSKAWKHRIVASLEPDTKDMMRVLRKELKSPGEHSSIFFGSRLYKGDLYGSSVR